MSDAKSSERPCVYCTAMGVMAILLWSTTIAFSRRLTDALGTFTAASGVYAVGGAAAIALLVLRRDGLRNALRLPKRYLLVCGSLFVLYTVMLYLAVGLAGDHRQTVEVGIVNYLWPSFVILMSVPILGRRARWTLWPGVAAALAGVALAKMPTTGLDPGRWLGNLQANPWPYAFAFIGAVTWGFYSNLSRRWTRDGDSNGAPLFLAASGVALLVIRMFVSEQSHWSARTIGELAYMGLLPAMAGYMLYDYAIRRGHIVVVASLAFFIPLLSTLVSCVFLDVPMQPTFWLACGLLIAGAVMSNWSVRPGKNSSADYADCADEDVSGVIGHSGKEASQ